ncbi:regulatory protein, Fis family [Quadrisphaera granulorum]|uniref:Regulatory Fis family protein n=1 Tax=Quadrisphaera granulorum TaxID=317664 RepID=A0A315ZWC4_9ACTN|nr:helix-turn-helix domain-containing protein [Quadrisphaera granulorum]PWJ49845.1 regulatory Fis family protein [Quadrisphaera granulorum]SZE98053.1 regulatory protein, Fis family [Quadrisphaera granulorum]
MPEALAGTSVDTSLRLRASWARCEHLEVPPDEVPPVFSGAVDVDPVFVESGRTVLADLRSTLAGEPVGVMLTDATGLVLQRFLDDAAMHRSLDRVHLAPGFSYAEAHAGTNGLALALADRAPSIVRGPEHYVESLREYTCAAAPVIDPRTGDIAGTVNLTTWSRSSSGLLLALATTAARSTSALMLARTGGTAALGPSRTTTGAAAAPRGQVYRVVPARAAGPADPCTSRLWRTAVEQVERALLAGRVVALAGEAGAGKTALVASARRRAELRGTLLAARTPGPEEVSSWMAAWTPVLHEDGACIVVSGTSALPAWAVDELAALLAAARRSDGSPQPFVLTEHDAPSLPEALAALVDVVVEVPPLRDRPDDVVPLAEHFARAYRHRDVAITPAAAQVLRAAAWPGGATQLRQVVQAASARTDVVDVRHLPADLASRTRRTLTRLEALERDEIVKALAVPGTTVAQAAERLGISRATVYRRISSYGIDVPRA